MCLLPIEALRISLARADHSPRPLRKKERPDCNFRHKTHKAGVLERALRCRMYVGSGARSGGAHEPCHARDLRRQAIDRKPPQLHLRGGQAHLAYGRPQKRPKPQILSRVPAFPDHILLNRKWWPRTLSNRASKLLILK